MTTVDIIAQNLVKYRKERKFSQEYLALEGQVSVRTLGKIERGEANPTVLVLERICETLEISVSELTAAPPSPDTVEYSIRPKV